MFTLPKGRFGACILVYYGLIIQTFLKCVKYSDHASGMMRPQVIKNAATSTPTRAVKGRFISIGEEALWDEERSCV